MSSSTKKNASITLESLSVNQTISIGTALGKVCEAGDTICLIGELGAGKTHFVKGIGIALRIPSDHLSSPTYTLITEHHDGTLPLYHMDAYRIVDLNELGPIGFDDYIGRSDGIVVIEWSNLIEDALPVDRVEVTLISPDSFGFDTSRTIDFVAYGQRSNELLTSFQNSLSSLNITEN